jgi:hypothetical protein
MAIRAEDYLGKRRDSRREDALAKQLRQMPEAERLAFIDELLGTKPVIALKLARTCLQQPASFEHILQHGLDHADASSINLWLEAVVNGLGFRRLASILGAKLATSPLAVVKARYWLPKWLPNNNPQAQQALRDLDAELAEVGKKNDMVARSLHPHQPANS